MTFAEMISSAESKNQEAGPVLSQAQNLATQFQSGTNQLQKKLVAATDSDFKQLQQAFPVIAFNLQELREQGKRLLDDATEDLINRLAIDGFNGWSQHYTTLSADLKFPVTLNDGQSLTLSAGQAQNRFESDLDPKNREIVFNQWEQTWSNHAANFADTLNHLAGFRLTDYQAHHEDNYLAVPLRLNRMHRETLDAMWASVSANKKPFTTYMAQKARLQGKRKWPGTINGRPLSLAISLPPPTPSTKRRNSSSVTSGASRLRWLILRNTPLITVGLKRKTAQASVQAAI